MLINQLFAYLIFQVFNNLGGGYMPLLLHINIFGKSFNQNMVKNWITIRSIYV